MCPDAVQVIISKAGEARAEHKNQGVGKALVEEKTRLGCVKSAEERLQCSWSRTSLVLSNDLVTKHSSSESTPVKCAAASN